MALKGAGQHMVAEVAAMTAMVWAMHGEATEEGVPLDGRDRPDLTDEQEYLTDLLLTHPAALRLRGVGVERGGDEGEGIEHPRFSGSIKPRGGFDKARRRAERGRVAPVSDWYAPDWYTRLDEIEF